MEIAYAIYDILSTMFGTMFEWLVIFLKFIVHGIADIFNWLLLPFGEQSNTQRVGLGLMYFVAPVMLLTHPIKSILALAFGFWHSLSLGVEFFTESIVHMSNMLWICAALGTSIGRLMFMGLGGGLLLSAVMNSDD